MNMLFLWVINFPVYTRLSEFICSNFKLLQALHFDRHNVTSGEETPFLTVMQCSI